MESSWIVGKWKGQSTGDITLVKLSMMFWRVTSENWTGSRSWSGIILREKQFPRHAGLSTQKQEGRNQNDNRIHGDAVVEAGGEGSRCSKQKHHTATLSRQP